MIVQQEETCFLADGTCLQDDRNISFYIIAWILSGAIVSLGAYLIFFERTQKEILEKLKEHKKEKKDGKNFDILLKGMSDEEKKVIKAVKDQDGITQSTLRLMADLHKSKLSIILNDLEKKGLISRKGKTKQVFLKINI